MPDRHGEPLNIGRKSRLIPPAIQRALRVRGDDCRFPGCTHKYFIDAHHIKHWADGGEASLDNLVQLCGYRDRLLHEHGFHCERSETGELRFSMRSGTRSGGPAHCGRSHPREWLQNELGNLRINLKTCVTKWAGERMGWHLAVGHLFDR